MRSKAINEIDGLSNQLVKNNSIIFGLGETGLSVARFLKRRGEHFVLVDTRDIPPNMALINEMFPETQQVFGAKKDFDISSFNQLVISPGLSHKEQLVEKAIASGISVIGDIELFSRHAEAPIIAITGSNGKSSVVTLVTEILQEAGYVVACGGNIGIPALDLLADPIPDYYVLEVSSFQLESVVNFAPEIAAVLNLSEDHMDRYDCFDDYVAAKLNIAKNAKHLVTHFNESPRMSGLSIDGFVTFSSNHETDADYKPWDRNGTRWIGSKDREAVEAGVLGLSGAHNLENALAAMAITDLAGASSIAQTKALQNFSGLEHRTEYVGTWNGVTWVNDSKGTNVGATLAAIKGVFEDSKGILIAGGVGKDADFSPLRSVIRDQAQATILFGQDADKIASVIHGASPLHIVTDLKAAIKLAKSLAISGTKVLFSPACASFDMFENYQQRGQRFKELVIEVNQS